MFTCKFQFITFILSQQYQKQQALDQGLAVLAFFILSHIIVYRQKSYKEVILCSKAGRLNISAIPLFLYCLHHLNQSAAHFHFFDRNPLRHCKSYLLKAAIVFLHYSFHSAKAVHVNKAQETYPSIYSYAIKPLGLLLSG